jgi:transcriptional regulator with XRE-family HTH domain
MPRPAGHRLNRDAFQDLLEIKGLSLSQVAAISGVKRATISSLCHGHHAAAVPTAHQIAAAVGCRPGTLFPTITPGVFQLAPDAKKGQAA